MIQGYSCSPKRVSSGSKSFASEKGRQAHIRNLRKEHGNFWKEARENAGLTQWDVAQVLGYKSGQFISNVESGRCRFPGEQLAKLQKLYGLKSNKILEVVLAEEELSLRHAFNLE